MICQTELQRAARRARHFSREWTMLALLGLKHGTGATDSLALECFRDL